MFVDAGKFGANHHHRSLLPGCKVKPGGTPYTTHAIDRLLTSRSRAATGGTNRSSSGTSRLPIVLRAEPAPGGFPRATILKA